MVETTKKILSLYIAVFLSVLLLYVLTLAPDLVWQDQGDYQYQVALRNLDRPGDVVRVHPLFIVFAHYLGRLTPLSYAYAANFTSALFAAITAANVFLLVYRLSRKIYPAILSTAVLAFSHSFWFLGVQAQTYSMANAALTAGILLAFAYMQKPRQSLLYLLGLVFGLGISAHMMSQIGFAVLFIWFVWLFFRGQFRFGGLLKIGISWFIGGFLLWFVMWLEFSRTGSITETIASAIWGKWGSAVFNLDRATILIAKSVMFFVLNFPTPLVILAVAGFGLSFKREPFKPFAYLLAVMSLLYCIFAMRYDVPNQNNFFLPMYILVAVYIGLGYSYLFDSKKAHIIAALLVLLILPAYPVMAHIAKQRGVEFGTRRHIPYRDVYTYYLIPWQHNQRGPRRLATEVLQALPENAIIIADSTVIPALEYTHYIEGNRQDIRLYTFHDSFDDYKDHLAAARAFTLSDVRGYYPRWVESEQLEPFSISDTEHIFEIVGLSE